MECTYKQNSQFILQPPKKVVVVLYLKIYCWQLRNFWNYTFVVLSGVLLEFPPLLHLLECDPRQVKDKVQKRNDIINVNSIVSQ
jgi:hypothetical protein